MNVPKSEIRNPKSEIKNQKSKIKRSLVYILVLAALASCAQRDQLTPKQSNVWLVSERREIAIGKEVAKEVEKEYPVFQDAELAAYVDQVGQMLVKNSDRPNIKYTFKVLDSPIANAFATPGGHIYITRGILGVLDDEAEMAGVLAHEIGHVCARHSAKQIQNSTLAQIALVAAGIALGDKLSNDMLTAVNYAVSGIFLGYSRGDEDQADLLGTKYIYRSGYDPEAMVGVLNGLLELQKRNPMKAEQYFQSHPLTKDRITHIQSWLPRIPKEDIWGGTPPQTNLRGRETYQRIAARLAVYAGGDEMQSTLENLRIGIVRGQKEKIAQALSDNYKDEQGRTKADYMAQLAGEFAASSRINFRISNIVTEPRRTGGAAKFEYVMERTNKASGKMNKETGRGYAEFVRPLPQVWKISSLKMVSL